MNSTGLAESWYRVAGLRPRLQPQARILRQSHRGVLWYVLQDQQSGRYFRISPAANLVLCFMDGRRTMQEIWEQLGRSLGADRPPQGEIVRLLSQLHQSDLLRGDVAPDLGELDRRAQRQRRNGLISALKSPMSITVPLFDPNRLLDRTMPMMRGVFSATGLVVWAALVIVGAVLAGMNWSELTADVADRVLAGDNLLLLALVYPFVKTLHELGHAYATKAGGGEVHEMGVMFLIFFPMPYVDASASSAIADSRRRALVGAAGIMVELALAAAAMILWLELEPSLLRAACFNVMVIGGVSTVLFNGNPLLRLDGYYVLCDLIQIPNLDTRAKRHIVYVLQRYVLGLSDVETPAQAPGERTWFVVYGVASMLYRITISFGIALFVAGQFFILGAALALWSMIQLLVLPVVRALKYLVGSSQLNGRRRRALLGSAVAVGLVGVALLIVPVPYATVAEGVVWVPDEDILRAGGEGFIQAYLAEPDSEVVEGQPLIQINEPVAAAQTEVKLAELSVLQHRFTAVNMIDPVQARLLAEQVDRARANLKRAEQRMSALVIRAGRSGRFIVPDSRKLLGTFIHEGELVGYIIGPNDVSIRVVVPQADIDQVRQHTRSVDVRLTESIDQSYRGSIIRQIPAALEAPPAPALAADGGGPILLDPASPTHHKPLDKFYEIELKLDGKTVDRIGGRVFARFDHGAEPVTGRLLRSVRQLFLRAIHV